MKKNILVFPSGSEVGLEIHKSLNKSIHINLFGASSIDDHGKFVFKNHISGLPFYNEPHFLTEIAEIIEKYAIDAIFPAMDGVMEYLKRNETYLNCKIICSDLDTVQICLSKSKTYNLLKDIVLVPKIYNKVEGIVKFPVFLKPDVGYGSRGVLKADSESEVISHLKNKNDYLILEYLPGKEYTVDCFSNFSGDLLFYGPRERKRINNGISVNTATMNNKKDFSILAEKINKCLKPNGAWFFQVKTNEAGQLCLLEVASRLGGSSSVYRMKGVNFALLSVFNAFEISVEIEPNDYEVELDRALDNSYRLSLNFHYVYVDFDDTLLIGNNLNSELIGCLYSLIGKGVKIILITKHIDNIYETLKNYRISEIFDEIIHLPKEELKSNYIKFKNAIFIDDSFQERAQIRQKLNIPVFAPDMVPALI